MRFVIGVVAHINREDMACNLAQQLKIEPQNVAWDDGTRGPTGNHRFCLQRLSRETADWYVVLEDDAQPIPHFKRQLAAALKHAPTLAVSLYLGTGHPTGAWQSTIQRTLAVANDAENPAAWIASKFMLHAVGYALHRDIIQPMLQHLNPDIKRPVDEQITAWCQGNRVLVSYCVPSLVDHADGPTVIAAHADGQPRSQPRKAWAVGGRDNWKTRSVLMVV